MNKFGFVLGKDTDLSLAEIFSILVGNNVEYKTIYKQNKTLIIESDTNPISISRLGGTIKIFRVNYEGLKKEEVLDALKKMPLSQNEKRVNFGISGYGKVDNKFVQKLGHSLKNYYLEMGLKSRFVTGKFSDLSSVIVHENKLIERGFEAILVEKNGTYILGYTLEVQDYKSYSKRDYGRPARDEKSGMLPPKLAQIMINLGAKNNDSSLYDPFCGSGTILMEALLMGYKNLVGSDISEKAIEDTKENLHWLEQKFSTPKIDVNNLFISDILSPQKEISSDLIVAEGYLGEPVRRNVAKAKEDAKELANFYLNAFSNLGRMLNDDGKIVIAVPFFIVGKEKIFLPIQQNLKLTGLKQVIIPEIKPNERQTLTYARPDSFVGREVFILKKA